MGGWVLGIGDGGWGPPPNPQSPIPNPQSPNPHLNYITLFIELVYNNIYKYGIFIKYHILYLIIIFID